MGDILERIFFCSHAKFTFPRVDFLNSPEPRVIRAREQFPCPLSWSYYGQDIKGGSNVHGHDAVHDSTQYIALIGA